MLLTQRAMVGGCGIALVAALALTGCGSRSILKQGIEEDECEFDDDCDRSDLCSPQSCVEGVCEVIDAVTCAAPPECFSNACNPQTGQCELSALTEDIDGDGARSPLVGFAPGEPGSCGDDCDDTDPQARPGGVEICDGADNDCDGIIDNGSSYLGFVDQEIPDLVPVASFGSDGSGRRGISYGDGVFGLGYWARNDNTVSYITGFNVFGERVFPETAVSNVNAPSFGADIVWSGDSFGATWADPRVDDNYEVYFARFDVQGNKLMPDLRVTDAVDFSIHPRIIYDQGRYIVVWDDRRDELVTGGTKVFAQVIAHDGTPIGENIQLSEETESAEYPYIAATDEALGVAYTSLSMGADEKVTLRFRTFDKETLEPSDLALLSDTDVRSPRVIAVGDVFVVTWDMYDTGPGDAIRGAVVNEDGLLIAGPEPITFGASFARSHGTVSLGDRFLLVWADDLYGNYEISAKVLDTNFNELESRRRLTDDEADSLGANVVLGESGRVGVLFDDWRSGTHQAYMLAVGCGEIAAR